MNWKKKEFQKCKRQIQISIEKEGDSGHKKSEFICQAGNLEGLNTKGS